MCPNAVLDPTPEVLTQSVWGGLREPQPEKILMQMICIPFLSSFHSSLPQFFFSLSPSPLFLLPLSLLPLFISSLPLRILESGIFHILYLDFSYLTICSSFIKDIYFKEISKLLVTSFVLCQLIFSGYREKRK